MYTTMARVTITNVAIFDGHELQPAPQTVVIEDGEITYPTSDSDPSLGDSNRTIDGTGCTLLPGLIDCHVHADHEAALAKFPPYGVTTTLDMGSPKDLQPLRATLQTSPSGKYPTYRSAGFFAAAKDSHHAKMHSVPDERIVNSPEEAEPFVARLVKEASDFIKVIADVPGFEEPVLSAFVEAARRHRTMSVAHAAFKASYERATQAGFDVLTHIPTDAILDDATVLKLKTDGRICVPTLGIMGMMCDLMNKSQPEANHSLDPALANLVKIHEAGIPICAGTDSNDLPFISMPHGKSLHRELELMARSMSSVDVLRSATSTAARCFGLAGKGEVKGGMRADLVLVEGNPVDDIGCISKIKAAWVDGVVVEVEVEDIKQ